MIYAVCIEQALAIIIYLIETIIAIFWYKFVFQTTNNFDMVNIQYLYIIHTILTQKRLIRINSVCFQEKMTVESLGRVSVTIISQYYNIYDTK